VFDPAVQVGKNAFVNLKNLFYVVPDREIEGVIILFDEVAKSYGMIHPGAADTSAARATFIIDNKGIIAASTALTIIVF
jgi:peroxiredoxin (alkyl hydroperoxide reductase subunit C)